MREVGAKLRMTLSHLFVKLIICKNYSKYQRLYVKFNLLKNLNSSLYQFYEMREVGVEPSFGRFIIKALANCSNVIDLRGASWTKIREELYRPTYP